MEWNDYLQQVLGEETCLDQIDLHYDGASMELPKIIKVSVFLLEKMIQNQGGYNLFVFPDGSQLPFLFATSKLIFNIYKGKIGKAYDPESFVPGQKLKLGDAIVEFVKIDKEKGLGWKESIYVKLAGGPIRICPLEYAPFFQTVETDKKLSSEKAYSVAKAEMDKTRHAGKNYLSTLIDMKTHITDSIFYVASLSKCRENAERIELDNKSLYECFLIGQTDYTGAVQTIKGKFTGVPALVFANQIAFVNSAISRGAKAQSVIINLAENDIENQIDALNELVGKGLPILCITDTVNSFNLSELQKRGFNIWRWDSESITNVLYNPQNSGAERTIERCVNSKVVYHEVSGQSISEAFLLLYKYRKMIENESAVLNKLYGHLFSMAYTVLRMIRIPSNAELVTCLLRLDACQTELEKERAFISSEVYEDFSRSIDLLRNIYANINFPKHQALLKHLLERRYQAFYLVCANNEDTKKIKDEWKETLGREGYNPLIKVVTVKEFLKEDRIQIRIAIVAGWFSANSVRKIIYGYNMAEVHLFLYECEKRWKKVHEKEWKAKLNSENNRNIATKSFEKSNQVRLELSVIKAPNVSNEDNKVLEEQDNLESILQENKYRQYATRTGTPSDIIVDAKPVSYVGGDFALYTAGHKLVVVTRIIHQMSNRIEEKEVDEVVVGDFVAIREYSKDLIRDVADQMLASWNKTELRKTVAIWKDALRIEATFSSLDDIYRRLKEVGCTRSVQAVRNWVYSDDQIITQSKEDLKYIAEMTGDSVLAEKLDEVFNAGRFIKNTHMLAGKKLSDRLSKTVAAKILEERIVDPYNIWDPIDLELDDVGPVKIYKIIDVGQDWIPININDANKVLTEAKEDLLWQE